MSIEYTIDIQLTELGYADILQPGETSVRETPKQTSDVVQTTVASPSPPSEPCTPTNPAQSPQLEQASKGTEALKSSVPRVNHVTGAAVLPQLMSLHVNGTDTAQGGSTETQPDVEVDSDDSEVSEMYEEEEVDEEEDDGAEEEEGLNSESSHSGDYRCTVCDLQLPSKFKLQDHMNLHTGARPYCCAECGKRFCQIYNYRVHLRTHAQTKVDQPQCRVCLRVFATEKDLKVHLSRTHFEDEFYECDLCKRVFTSLKACQHHVESHKCKQDVVCKICGRNFSSPKSLARHRKRTCHCTLKCTDCTKTFTKKNALLKHSFSHLGLLPYTCIRCRCHFRLAKLYRQHKCEPERIHCVACLREFLSQEDFQQHKKDTGCWGNQEPKGDEIRCLECGQRFDTSEELKQHAGAHQRVLKCAECGKGFRSALLLMSHMGGHAGNSPCLCQSCGLGFPHQQNYDSHLKTCGQTPQPASAPKKRQASKSQASESQASQNQASKSQASESQASQNQASKSQASESQASQNQASKSQASESQASQNQASKSQASESQASSDSKKINAKPKSLNPTNTDVTPAGVSKKPAAPVKDSPSPGGVTGDVSSGSGPSDGLWKLTLDKQPPPGVKLVVFLPVCATQSNSLTLPSANSPTLPIPAMQIQPQLALPPFSNELVGVNAALGTLLNAPLDLVTGIKQDPEWDKPLDLSMKCNSSKSADIPLLPIKSEPGEFEISGEASSTDRQEFKNFGKAIVKTNPGETDTGAKPFKMDPVDLSFNVDTTSSGLMTDIKTEPQSPGPDLDSQSSTSCLPSEKEIKMEVDISHPADVEK